MPKRRSSDFDPSQMFTGGCGIFVILIALSTIPAWITHIVVCLHDGKWGFLIAGALAFPVAIIHGWGIWFGWWN